MYLFKTSETSVDVFSSVTHFEESLYLETLLTLRGKLPNLLSGYTGIVAISI
jgi:hypothetical protein